VRQREVADPGEYVGLWLSDAGLRPGTGVWWLGYQHWMDWFDPNDVVAVGMGLACGQGDPVGAAISLPPLDPAVPG
jgi:hypothetical protein